MEQFWDYLDNHFNEYWWILIILTAFILIRVFESYFFKKCPRCGSQSISSRVYKDHCNICFDTDQDQFKEFYGKDIKMNNTGYEPD